MSLLAPIVEIFRYGLEPVAPFSWFGINVNTLDVAGAIRLCLIMRQVREEIARAYQAHAQSKLVGEKSATGGPRIESKSFVRDLAATLVVVHGGDIAGAFCVRVSRVCVTNGLF